MCTRWREAICYNFKDIWLNRCFSVILQLVARLNLLYFCEHNSEGLEMGQIASGRCILIILIAGLVEWGQYVSYASRREYWTHGNYRFFRRTTAPVSKINVSLIYLLISALGYMRVYIHVCYLCVCLPFVFTSLLSLTFPELTRSVSRLDVVGGDQTWVSLLCVGLYCIFFML